MSAGSHAAPDRLSSAPPARRDRGARRAPGRRAAPQPGRLAARRRRAGDRARMRAGCRAGSRRSASACSPGARCCCGAGSRPPPGALLLALALAVAAGVRLEFGHFFGREPGVALLVLLLGLKLLETRAARDIRAGVLLCLFLQLALFFEDQSLPVAALALAGTPARHSAPWSRSPTPAGSEREHLRTAATLLAQGLPFMLVLFVLFPRIQGPLWGLPADAFSARTGLSETMRPGSISALGQSERDRPARRLHRPAAPTGAALLARPGTQPLRRPEWHADPATESAVARLRAPGRAHRLPAHHRAAPPALAARPRVPGRGAAGGPLHQRPPRAQPPSPCESRARFTLERLPAHAGRHGRVARGARRRDRPARRQQPAQPPARRRLAAGARDARRDPRARARRAARRCAWPTPCARPCSVATPRTSSCSIASAASASTSPRPSPC